MVYGDIGRRCPHNVPIFNGYFLLAQLGKVSLMARRNTFGRIDKRPNGRFRARYVHFTEPYKADGSPNLISAGGTFATKTEANIWLAGVQGDYARGEWKSPDQVKAEQIKADAEARLRAYTFGDYAETFFATRDYSPNTERPERSRLNIHLLPRWGTVPLSAITTAEVKAWAVTLAPGAPGNRQKAYSLFSNILNSAVNDELIERNPCPVKGLKGIKAAPVKPSEVKQAKREPRALSSEQLEALAAAMPGIQGLMVLVQGRMGLRIGEARALRGGSVAKRPDGKVELTVTTSASNGGKYLHVKSPKTVKGLRTLTVPAAMSKALLEQAAKVGKRGILFPSSVDPKKYTSDSSFAKSLSRHGKRLNIGHVTPHDLRHTAASIWIGNGIATHVVSEMLGHTHSAITARYTHTYAEQFDQAAEVVSNLMGQPSGVASLDERRAAAVN